MERAITIGLVSFLVLVGGLPGFAGAEEAASAGEDVAEAETRQADGWSTSISIGFDVLMQETTGGFDSNLEQRSQAKPSGKGSEFFVNPMFGLGGEVTTPVLLDIPGQPRLYFGAGIRYVQPLPHTYATSGDTPGKLPDEKDFFPFGVFKVKPTDLFTQMVYPDELTIDGEVFFLGGVEVNPNCPDKSCPKEFVGGQGTSINAEYAPLFWQTELGFVFSVPLEERTLRIKPAVGYIQQQMKISGKTSRVYREVIPCQGKACNDFIIKPGDRDFATAEFGGDIRQTFRSVGPKLMLELDTAHFTKFGQRFGASIFADVGVFWMVSDRRVEFSAEQLVLGEDHRSNGGGQLRTERFGSGHVDLQRTDFFFEMKELSYRFGIGFRLTWYPK